MASTYFQEHGIVIMSSLFVIFFAAFIVILVLYIIKIENEGNEIKYTTWTGVDQGNNVFFGLNLSTNQFLSYTSSFEVIGVTVDNVAEDFFATLTNPTINLQFIYSGDVNIATIIVEPDSTTRRTILLSRLTLQSLVPAFNSAQNVDAIPTLFSPFSI